jgi:L-ascorbate metabolism protein UlaG (beta-lactamase superfamily)
MAPVQEADCNLQPLDELLAFAREHDKPVMIAESTPQRYKTGELTFSYDGANAKPKTADEIWSEWYAPFFQYIHDNSDVIRALAYINADWDSQPMWGKPYRNGYWGDSRVQTNDQIKQRWLAEIEQDFWLNASPDLFETLNYAAADTEEETVMEATPDITWLRSTNQYGHTAVMIQADDRVIYLDPVDLVSIEDLPKAHIILVTHDHGDHFSPDTIATLSAESTVIISNESITRKFTAQDTYTLSPGEKASVNGLEIEAIPAYNSTHAKSLGYLGFVLSVDGNRIYCSGDTGLNPEMEQLAGIDIAILNVRTPYALSGEQVVAFAETVEPKVIIPIHWMPDDDTFADSAEIETIKSSIPDTTLFTVLGLH